MDLPYAWSDGSNGVHKPAWDPPYVSSKYYNSNTLMLNTPNPYEDSEVNGDSCNNLNQSWAEPPVEIHEECTTDIDLPPLVWHGYDVAPKLLSVCNTGRTITVNGQWPNGKPYIEGGPLNGKYIFSQIHFHCPSEHEIDGRRYPLEMHVVHYKNSYLTQERAMHEKDGTLVLVYLFQVVETEETVLSEITKMGTCLANINSRLEINKIPLSNLVKPFFCNYYVYWGSVMMKKNSYILQWIINCNQSQVTKQEVDTLLNAMSSSTVTAPKGPKMKPHNSIIYRVGENYDVHGPSHTVNTETSTSMRFDIVIETDPAPENIPQTLCLHASSHPHQRSACNTCPGHSASCPAQAVPTKCSTHDSEIRCPHAPAEVTVQAQEKSNSQTQNVCGTCGGLEVEIKIPKHVCKCKEKLPKVCSSCGGSKSGISWCKRKWKQCASKCSLWSKTSSCSNTCSSKRKPLKKKSCPKKSSDTSCNEKRSDSEKCSSKKSSACIEKKDPCDSEEPCETPCPPPPKDSKNCIDVEPRRVSCEEPSKESCKKPSSTEYSSTSCSTPCASATDLSTAKKKKKEKKEKKKPRCQSKRQSITSVKKVEKKKIEKIDTDCKASKKSLTKKEAKSSSEKKNNEIKDSNKSHKGKSESKNKDKSETSEMFSEKDDKKKKIVKKKKTEEEECDEITTLFVKMPENVFPPCIKSSQSCSEETSVNEKKENCEDGDLSSSTKQQEPEYIVNTLTTPGLKMPKNSVNSTSKEVYLQMKHSFQLEKSHSASVSQEFQVSIVCDSNVLQEYKGLFQPQEITLGSFEKLQLVPKYKEPDDLTVRLQECVIKKPSLDKFCIDSKFLLKGINPKDVFPKVKKEHLKDLNEKMFSIFDAGTQYSKEEIELTDPLPLSLASQSVQTDETYVPVTDKIKRIFCKKLDVKSQNVQTEPQNEEQKNKITKDLIKCKTRIIKTTSEPEFLSATKKYLLNQYINLMEAKLCKSANANSNKLSEKLECKIKLMKNPQSSTESTDVGSSSKLMQKKDVDLEAAQRNTVYFMYDRIEKDPLTGKKIFMGRFRTRDDLKILKEHQITSKTDSLKSFGSRTTTEDCSSASSRMLNIEKLNDLPLKKDLNAGRQKLSQSEVSVHKFESKCLELTRFKARNSNLVSDVVKWFQEDGENFDHLADIIVFDKKEKLKNFERPEVIESVCDSDHFTESKSRSENSDFVSLTYEDKSTMCSSHSLLSQNMENSVALRSLDSEAVIIVPVEVESWSKIEVVLIERSDDQEAIKRSKKYVPLL